MRAVTDGPGEDAVPSWSRDGASIFFASTRSGKNEIWKMAVPGGKLVQLTSGGGFAPIPSEDGKFVYYAKENAPGIWQIPANSGDEKKLMDDLQVGLWGQWTVSASGIYFVSRGRDGRYEIKLFRLPEGRIEHVFTLAKPPAFWTEGLGISRDDRTILYTQSDSRSNIKIVENFH
jgi:hypothetical protein